MVAFCLICNRHTTAHTLCWYCEWKGSSHTLDAEQICVRPNIEIFRKWEPESKFIKIVWLVNNEKIFFLSINYVVTLTRDRDDQLCDNSYTSNLTEGEGAIKSLFLLTNTNCGTLKDNHFEPNFKQLSIRSKFYNSTLLIELVFYFMRISFPRQLIKYWENIILHFGCALYQLKSLLI